ncbi:MAG: helix-turn-helix transcriptional regulator, partial [Roseburia sp.]|nr:helix-turn-helix transcriptional regulator [Roseburia sp.]
ERYNILLDMEIGKTDEPGIAGISQVYRKLISDEEDAENTVSKEDPRGRELVDYIDSHYCDPDISLKTLADQWNLSVPTVSRLCREAAGTSFLAYLTALRLQKAKELLLESKDSPAKIAPAVGYTSEYSFRRAFQRNENCKLQDWIAENRK